MGIIKETDNITFDVFWKGWKKSIQRSEYLLRTRSIVEKIAYDAKVYSKKDGWTSLNIELPHKELEDYSNLLDEEYQLDYTKADQLLDLLKADEDVASIQIEINENERGGSAYVIDHNNFEVINTDDEGLPLVVRLYPLS